jgi:NAD(P)-dependent dehydrogenase (short-subunit alcohol dehydrogenase family)
MEGGRWTSAAFSLRGQAWIRIFASAPRGNWAEPFIIGDTHRLSKAILQMGHPLLDLADKTAVVVGGTSGIGLALAKGLAEAGANVVPTGRREVEARAATAAIEGFGRKSLAVTCDVTQNASLERLLAEVRSAFGKVDILINCAGRTKRTPTLEVPEEEWNAIMETNLNGTLRACRVFGKHMIERGYGRIINITSLGSYVGLFDGAYSE